MNITTVPSTSATITPDRFCDPSYVDPAGKLPLIQSLRGEDPKQCGYFVSLKEMAKANWIGAIPTLENYSYSSGNTEEGIILRQPRMLVVPRSNVRAYDRVKSVENQTLELVGEYRDFKGQPNIGNVQLFEVLLLDSNNKPLHEIAFRYAAKGATQATFAIHYQQLVNEVTLYHAKANGISARPKNAQFNALCVFEFKVIREAAGDVQKSPACKVGSHTKPTIDNWQDFFLGRVDSVADEMLQLLSVPVSSLKIVAATPVITEELDRVIGAYDGDGEDIYDIPF
jgi:hypothetical protein